MTHRLTAANPTLQIRVTREFIEDVDLWRRKQRGFIINRSEAIRRLVYLGMTKEKPLPAKGDWQ